MSQTTKNVGLVLQGGGALGAYETGAIQRIYEKGYRPEILTGTSIGALNAAVLAAPKYGEANETLQDLWDYLGHEHPFPLFQQYNTAYTSLGHPRFFKLHGSMFGAQRPSIYDVSPALDTMRRFINFDFLNSPEAPTVVVTATNIVSGEIERFSNRKDTLTPEHIMASGALPPSFPPIEIDGQFYWDGGIYDNTPIQSLVRILNEHEVEHLPIFVIELFGALGDVPKDLNQSIDRMTELIYEDKFWKTYEGHEKAYEFAEMLWELDGVVPEDSPVRELEAFTKLMRRRAISHIFTIPAERAALRNVIDFSPSTIQKRIDAGYKAANHALDKDEFRINYILHSRLKSERNPSSDEPAKKRAASTKPKTASRPRTKAAKSSSKTS
ncbi:patatin-like phospholipase family protein [Labrenzia sp. PHM005]|uniref:patatin-like phospholipase family protein n=1 Tax=Labrenzia sp. PHM005 TaxID=2590016 RepID=UPI00113FD89E|nr:patatin-like phospholipase family protein [Labrenzia sp. PHM005]QDG79003.1 patatin-like phospholipase family protein [Labrenzia sp. PHM005]